MKLRHFKPHPTEEHKWWTKGVIFRIENRCKKHPKTFFKKAKDFSCIKYEHVYFLHRSGGNSGSPLAYRLRGAALFLP
jgi:hypothetical protein